VAIAFVVEDTVASVDVIPGTVIEDA